MTKPTPHPHAEMIIEWAKDTSRKVECSTEYDPSTEYDTEWVAINHDPSWLRNTRYRFADTVKPKIVSSLTEEERKELWRSEADGFKAIADAAAQRAIEDLKGPPIEWYYDNWPFDNHSDVAIEAIEKYLRYIKN